MFRKIGPREEPGWDYSSSSQSEQNDLDQGEQAGKADKGGVEEEKEGLDEWGGLESAIVHPVQSNSCTTTTA